MAVYYDLVRFYTRTTGTGSLTEGSRVPGFRNLAEVPVPDGTEIRYTIFSGLDKEVGLGTYTAGVLSRDTVNFSTNSNNKIEVGLNAVVAVVFAAEDINAVVNAADTITGSVLAAEASAAAAALAETAAEAAQAAAEAAAAGVPSIDTDGTLAANSDLVVPSQKAVKTYVDGKVVNLGKRQRVRAATTANIAIATALNNADTLDGVSLVTGDLVLVKDQSAPAENGIYTVGVVPARATEFDTYNEHPGSLIAVEEGTVNADTLWLCISNDGGTLNTTAIAFSQVRFSAASETVSGIVELATTAEAEAGSDTSRAVTPAGVKAAVTGEHTVNLLTAGMVARTTNGATAYSTEKVTNDVMVRGYEFSAGTEQAIQLSLPLPKGYNSTPGLVPKFYWTTSAVAGTGNVIWGMRARYSRDDDAIDAAWGTAVEVTDGFLLDGDTHKSTEAAACTPGGTYAAECMLRVEIYRKAADGADTYTQTSILEAVMVSLPMAEMTDD